MKCANNKYGFTLVETLIALAIAAMLLAAVAVAFNASVVNFQENEEMFSSMNNARQALTRMTAQLRTSNGVNLSDPNNSCSLITSDGEDITFEFRDSSYSIPADRNKLFVITNSDSSEYLLCDNVTAMNFLKTPLANGINCKSVQITMSVKIGDSERVLSAASVIRRNLE